MKSLIYLFFGFFYLGIYAQTDLDLAESYYDKGEFQKALYLFQKLQVKQPNNNNYVFRVVKIQQELEDFKAAEQLLKNQLKKTGNPQYRVALGYNFQLQNQIETAQEYYKQAMAKAAETPAFSNSIALKFEEYSLVDQAIEVYKLAISETQNNSYQYRLAGLYAIKQDLENMFLSYLNFAEYNTSYNNQILQLFRDYISENPKAQYNLLLKKILLKKMQTNTNTYWNEMLSWLYVQQKEYIKALKQQKAIFRRNQNSLQGIIDLALLSKNDMAYDVAYNAFDFVVQNTQEPKLTIEAKRQILILELLYFESPEYKRIQSDYTSLFERYGIYDETVDLQLSYIDFLAFHYNKNEAAISFLERCLKRDLSALSNAKLKLKMADILLTQEQFNRALVFYTQVHTQVKNSTLAQEARFKAAKTSFYKADFDWAEAQLNVLKSSTSQLIANDALYLKLLIADHKTGDSLKSALKLYSKADFLQLQKKPKQAYETLEDLILNYPTHGIVDDALMLQAQILESEADFSAAAEKYQIVIQDFPTEILADDAYFALAELFRTALEAPQKALAHYETIIFKFQDSIHAVESKRHYRQLKDESENLFKKSL